MRGLLTGRFIGGGALGLMLLGSLWLAPSAATKSALYPAALRSPVNQLDAAIAQLPRHSPRQARIRRSLLSSIHGIELQLRHRQGCRARTLIRALRRQLGHSGLTATTNVQLSSASLRLEAALLGNPLTRRCGGARTLPAGKPVTRISISSPTELRMTVTLPAIQFVPKKGRGKAYQQLQMPGLSSIAP